MAGSGAERPAENGLSAAEILNSAQQAAQKAAAAAEEANGIKETINKELSSLLKDRERLKTESRKANVTLYIGIITLIILIWHGWSIWNQADTIQRQLVHAQQNARTALLQQLSADMRPLEDFIYDSQDVLQILVAADPNCILEPPLNMRQVARLDRFVHQFLGHYERYFISSYALGLESDWTVMCKQASRLMGQYCHLETRVQTLLENVSPEFREGFERCVLSSSE